MNERILQLAEQAELSKGVWAVPDFILEKFAELIIKECLEQVRDEVQYGSDWKLADAVTKRVMEHFGVEQ